MSDETRAPITPQRLRVVEGGGLHLSVKDGVLEARFSFDVYLRFVERFVCEDEQAQIVAVIAGERAVLVPA